LSFEIYHPKNNVHNQDGNHDDNKVRVTIYFFELTGNDGQNFLAGIVLLKIYINIHQTFRWTFKVAFNIENFVYDDERTIADKKFRSQLSFHSRML
jgi:hypothetical protein